MMIIPRENGMVRVSVKVDDIDRSQVSPETIIALAQKGLAPYKIDFSHCDWFAVWRSNRRLATCFSKYERVFLAGDAVHTHSPKAGIGLNFSLQDSKPPYTIHWMALLMLMPAYNLGWKIAHVIKGVAKPSLLKTYEMERREVAQQLLSFDEDLSSNFTNGEAIKKAFTEALPFTSCTSIEYGPSMIVAKPGANIVSKQNFAQHITVGRRFPSQQVVEQDSGRPLQFQECFPSDGKYRLVVFAGDIARPEQLRRVEALGRSLALPQSSWIQDSGGIFDILMLHSSRREDVRLCKLPSTLSTHSKSNVFADNVPYVGELGTAYQAYGVDRLEGCIVVVRPDGHVMYTGGLEDLEDLNKMLSDILL
ncbi:Monooxygenase FAD-binding protein [Macrophomina phaseolina MS6]|uniref:Monooxygenase FAD-binding protein n=1 Tax=Macrophomina phaseolina (strain MS6) TaxID=1126212 RepID=K2R3F1_MACPH|nr:Monooxygenase FAD-binding protein [Macrophomina phaseolina MS6]